MPNITVYHNNDSRFMPYEDGHRLVAVTSHWLQPGIATTPAAVAEWAFATFNVDLDTLETARANPGGETTFLAACLYRLLGHRSLSVGDVVAVHTGDEQVWLACDPFGWRPIVAPTHDIEQPLTAETVYAFIRRQRQP